MIPVGRPDIDTFDEYRRAHPKRIDPMTLFHGGAMFRYRQRRERIASSRARDLRMISGGFLAGVLAAVAVAVLAVGAKVMT